MNVVPIFLMHFCNCKILRAEVSVMSKRKKNKRYSQENSGNFLVVIIVALIVVIGGGTIWALSSGNNSGGTNSTNSTNSTNPTGGQTTSSLESEVNTLTEQVKNNPNDAALHENLGTALFNLANTYKQSNDPKTLETFNKSIEVYKKTVELNPNSK